MRLRPSPAGLAAVASALVAPVALAAPHFERVASFPVHRNLPAGANPLTETSAEIVAASADGTLLVYTDGPRGGIGFVDVSDPEVPNAAGFLALDGEPTSVAVVGDRALVALDTSTSHVEPSGTLLAVDLGTRAVGARCALAGQPDAVAASPDGARLAIAIENERDEDLDDGALPQLPAGTLQTVALDGGEPDCDSLATVDLTGLAEIAPADPEPEFVDVNGAGEIVASLQENNALVVVAASGEILEHFSAGAVDLEGIDVREDGALVFDGAQPGRLREPDAVAWLDDERFATANEGDLDGGARGFTIFSKAGEVLHESGTDLERRAVRAGHYPEERSGNKGIEPEGLEVGAFGGETYLFVLAERASVVGVYRDTGGAPEFVQLLPTGLAPEGAVAMPERGLLAVAAEADLGAEGGPRSHVSLYRFVETGEPSYPEIVSADASTGAADGTPLGWGALSGLIADPEMPGRLYAVADSFYRAMPRVYAIDASAEPAVIESALEITRDGVPARLLDLEGITTDGEGGFWLASEGRRDRGVPHALYRVDATGEIVETVGFPDELEAVQRRFGAEGIARVGSTLWIAIQRPWRDDPENVAKLLAHDLETGTWRAAGYPLETPAGDGRVGLSEIVAADGALLVLERDDRIGEDARVKRVYRVELDGLETVPVGETLPIASKSLVRDLLPMLEAGGGHVPDKVEGLAVDVSGAAYAVTDNDGVDDSNGETRFLRLGTLGASDG